MSREQGIDDLTPDQEEFLDRVQGKDFGEFVAEGKKMLREKAQEKPYDNMELTEGMWSQSIAIQILEYRIDMLEDTLEMMALTIEMATRNLERHSGKVPDINDVPDDGGWQN